jgi:hypothetical protein
MKAYILNSPYNAIIIYRKIQLYLILPYLISLNKDRYKKFNTPYSRKFQKVNSPYHYNLILKMKSKVLRLIDNRFAANLKYHKIHIVSFTRSIKSGDILILFVRADAKEWFMYTEILSNIAFAQRMHLLTGPQSSLTNRISSIKINNRAIR